MEGFGYDNWADDSGYDTSTPPTYTSENYGFGAKKGAASKPTSDRSDVYDFDIYDGASSSRAAAPKSKEPPKQSRRMSTEDRANEILRKSISDRKSIARESRVEDDSAAFSSFQESWKELMVGIEAVPGSNVPTPNSESPRSSFSASPRPDQQPHWSQKDASPFNSPGSESFEISAADLEV